ncbi:MAG: hypothetical protein EON87_16090 [Brevundimonas sp.]|nr:MAG: hypothetical protein EON87_16090 [Brevundimonas sp.]
MAATSDPIVRAGIELLGQYYRAIEDKNGPAFRHALAGFRALDAKNPEEMDRAREIYFGF